jgi:hypothetical protein
VRNRELEDTRTRDRDTDAARLQQRLNELQLERTESQARLAESRDEKERVRIEGERLRDEERQRMERRETERTEEWNRERSQWDDERRRWNESLREVKSNERTERERLVSVEREIRALLGRDRDAWSRREHELNGVIEKQRIRLEQLERERSLENERANLTDRELTRLREESNREVAAQARLKIDGEVGLALRNYADRMATLTRMIASHSTVPIKDPLNYLRSLTATVPSSSGSSGDGSSSSQPPPSTGESRKLFDDHLKQMEASLREFLQSQITDRESQSRRYKDMITKMKEMQQRALSQLTQQHAAQLASLSSVTAPVAVTTLVGEATASEGKDATPEAKQTTTSTNETKDGAATTTTVMRQPTITGGNLGEAAHLARALHHMHMEHQQRTNELQAKITSLEQQLSSSSSTLTNMAPVTTSVPPSTLPSVHPQGGTMASVQPLSSSQGRFVRPVATAALQSNQYEADNNRYHPTSNDNNNYEEMAMSAPVTINRPQPIRWTNDTYYEPPIVTSVPTTSVGIASAPSITGPPSFDYKRVSAATVAPLPPSIGASVSPNNDLLPSPCPRCGLRTICVCDKQEPSLIMDVPQTTTTTTSMTNPPPIPPSLPTSNNVLGPFLAAAAAAASTETRSLASSLPSSLGGRRRSSSEWTAALNIPPPSSRTLPSSSLVTTSNDNSIMSNNNNNNPNDSSHLSPRHSLPVPMEQQIPPSRPPPRRFIDE